MKIDIQNDTVIEDGVKLLKSHFVDLYIGLGYSKVDASLAWHNIRVSSKGRALMAKLYEGHKHIQALSMINVEEEINFRNNQNTKPMKANRVKNVSVDVEVSAPDNVVVEAVVAVPQETKVVATGDRGDKTAKAKALIAAGETSAKEIAEKSGAAVAYVRTLLYNARKATKQ